MCIAESFFSQVLSSGSPRGWEIVKKHLYTIGYEGAVLGDFLATLKQVGITHLVDVRELPISRRKGFAKTALSEALDEAGIEYLHLKGLGDPKEGRDAARAGDIATFKRVFSNHLRTKAALHDLERAYEVMQIGAACLMCYERSPSDCHRSIVAKRLSDLSGVTVAHLGVRHGSAKNDRKIGKGARLNSGQGAAARR